MANYTFDYYNPGNAPYVRAMILDKEGFVVAENADPKLVHVMTRALNKIQNNKKPHIGTVSWGTHRPSHLIPKFLIALEKCNFAKYSEIRSRCPIFVFKPDSVDKEWFDTEDAAEVLDDLFKALRDAGVDNYLYFGAHDGDGADFGFWVDWDRIEDDLATGEIQEVTSYDRANFSVNQYVLVNNTNEIQLYRNHELLWDLYRG